MPRKRHTAEQIIGKLRAAEIGLAQCGTGLHCRNSEDDAPVSLPWHSSVWPKQGK